jgi:hypothetical protein
MRIMAATTAPSVPVARRVRPPREAWGLIAVAAGFALIQLVLVRPWLLFGWDETVYLSQVSPHVSAEYFSPPRFRGISYLAAPIAVLTHSVIVIRLYMTLLSAAGLVAAFWPWLGLLGRRAATLAALLLVSLWVVQFYGNQVMPNLYDAYCAVAVTGWLLVAARRDTPGKGPLAGIVAGLGLMALLRLGDAVFLTAALAVAVLVIRRHRIASLAALAGGLAIGVIPWLIEAWVRYGGPSERLRLAERTEGGMGLHFHTIWLEFRAVNGPILCRPCTGKALARWTYPVQSAWWLLLPILIVAGLVVAARTGRLRPALVATAAGGAVSVPYLLTLQYAAPRFLIPAYALAVIPAALAVEAGLARRKTWLTAAIVALIAAQFVSQFVVLGAVTANQDSSRRGMRAIARHLHALGLRPGKCALAGMVGPVVGYYSGCTSSANSEDNYQATPARLLRTARSNCQVAYITTSSRRPAHLAGWRHDVFHFHERGKVWNIYLPPC